MGPAIKIMIVEDEIIAALALGKNLKRRGYTVCKFISSGEEALQKIGEERPDVVLMDIQLQGTVNGLEAARQIHSRFSIPIAFITGYTDPQLIDCVPEIDCIGIFVKPVNINELIDRIKTFFDSRKSSIS